MSTADARTRPSPARMYDYFLSGRDHLPVDREAGDRVIARVGEDLTRHVVGENRRFLGRAVDALARAGVDQFIDVGAGLPTQENTHQVAQRVLPDARVVYVDNDPVAAEQGADLVDDPARVRFLTADARNPEAVLAHPDTRTVIDTDRPVAVLLVAVLHFVTDDEDPAGIVRTFRDACVPGSYLALSHLVTTGSPPEERRRMDEIYRGATAPMVFREPAAVRGFFDGYELLDPGLVPTGSWRAAPGATATGRMMGAVGRRT